MALVLDADVGSATANAYADVAEANERLAYRIGASAWEDTDDDVKIQALVTAARELDSLSLYGARATSDQALEFPRTGEDEYGVAMPVDDIPYFWWLANIEYAFWLATHQTTAAVDLLNPAVKSTKRAKSGDDEVEFFAPTGDQADATSVAQFPPAVQRLIDRYVYDEVPVGWGSATVTRTS